ncbi:MAG: SLOG family protein [Defluviitaleaceae bacterium]|nr:SLOG family protein [Defluviitaleaceae bacterium]
MDKTSFSCCFSGHRDASFSWTGSYEGHVFQIMLAKAIDDAIHQGCNRFYNGMARGFDIIAAEAVILAKNHYDVELVAAIPFRGQEVKWAKDWKVRHDEVLQYCDQAIYLNEGYVTGCYHQRNRYLVDNSSRLICFYSGKAGGTRHTHDYAEEKGLNIINLWKNHK